MNQCRRNKSGESLQGSEGGRRVIISTLKLFSYWVIQPPCYLLCWHISNKEGPPETRDFAFCSKLKNLGVTAEATLWLVLVFTVSGWRGNTTGPERGQLGRVAWEHQLWTSLCLLHLCHTYQTREEWWPTSTLLLHPPPSPQDGDSSGLSGGRPVSWTAHILRLSVSWTLMYEHLKQQNRDFECRRAAAGIICFCSLVWSVFKSCAELCCHGNKVLNWIRPGDRHHI